MLWNDSPDTSLKLKLYELDFTSAQSKGLTMFTKV